MNERLLNRLRVLWKGCVVVFALSAVSMTTASFATYLTMMKYAPTAKAETVVAPEHDAAALQSAENRLAQLKEELLTKDIQLQKMTEAYRQLKATYKAQLELLAPKIKKADDQLAILQEPAQRMVRPMTHREVEEKTYQLLGIKGVTR